MEVGIEPDRLQLGWLTGESISRHAFGTGEAEGASAAARVLSLVCRHNRDRVDVFNLEGCRESRSPEDHLILTDARWAIAVQEVLSAVDETHRGCCLGSIAQTVRCLLASGARFELRWVGWFDFTESDRHIFGCCFEVKRL